MKDQRMKPAPTSGRPTRRGIIRKADSIAVPSLLLLIALNAVVFFYQVWTLLPSHETSLGSSNNKKSPNDKDLWGEENNSDPDEPIKSFKRRIRPDDAASATTDSPAESLKKALGDNLNGNDETPTIPYDIVPRILEPSSQFYGIVHQLPSIPKNRRMTPDQTKNLTYFLESREFPNVDDQPLYMYNPMLLPLDEEIIDKTIIEDLTLGEKDSNVKYVAVFRLSNFANCHGPGRGVPETFRNYLGIALLDRDLNIVKDPTNGNYLDVIIDINQDIFDADWTPTVLPKNREKRKVKPWMQDCQLFAARIHSSRTRNQLVLLCNEYAWPVLLQREGATKRSAAIDDGQHEKSKIYFQNKYGRGLHLTGIRMPNELLRMGKNMHYFTAGPDKFGPGFLEIWAAGPHTVLPVNFENYPFVNNHFPPRPLEAKEPEPGASYKTLDARQPEDTGDVLKDRDSGSACCVPIQWDDGSGSKRKLLLGVSHTKTRRGKAIKKSKMYNYVSRVYAFDPLPPFNLVARSGYFCLGFGLNTFQENANNAEAEESDNEQVWGAANDYKLEVRDEFFECPRIHFVSGIAEKIDDPETVIISYGINDCYPRMIEVPKNFLVQLLKPGK